MPSHNKQTDKPANLEAALWDSANMLRSNMDAAEYKHVVLGLIFLKYVSDVFAVRRAQLEEALQDPASDYFMPTPGARSAILESRDEYTSEGVFWVPEGYRWDDLRIAAKQSDIGTRIDASMDAIERENPSLKGVLPKNYARRELTAATLGGLIDTFSREDLAAREHQDLDVLGRVFEYMVGQFASAEGKLGGEFYTPRSVVKLMVEMLEPFSGRVYDPACGSGGMFVQADRFVKAHGGVRNDISVFGQEQNPTTWRLAKMNLALRGIDANLGPQWGDSFANDSHPDLRADFVIANPPFNISDWGGGSLRDDPRWKYGVPPAGNANFAWIQHMLHHLAPTGTMATVLANGALTSTQSSEAEVRRNLVEADLVECIVALPTQLFYTTQISVSLWFLTKSKDGRKPGKGGRHDRRGQVLFVDATRLGTMTSKVHRELTNDEIARIADTYHAWRGASDSVYQDLPGFCASVEQPSIRQQQFMLGPSRYVGFQDDATPAVDVREVSELASLTIDALLEKRIQIQTGLRDALQSLNSDLDPTSWNMVRIGDVARVVGGGTPKSSDPGNFGGTIPWITPKDLTQHVGRYISSGARSLSDVGLSGSSARLIPAGSVLVSSRAPIGLVAISGGELATNQGIRSLILQDSQVPEFWYYLMKLSTRTLEAHANGTTFREISGSSLADLRFRVPPLEEQGRLAALLGKLDSEIENNLLINATLAGLVEAQARQWFGA